MTDDPRCCGSGTCLINAEGVCWCGQRWDGDKMCFANEASQAAADTAKQAEPLASPPSPGTQARSS
jgi:hypothetical protein